MFPAFHLVWPSDNDMSDLFSMTQACSGLHVKICGQRAGTSGHYTSDYEFQIEIRRRRDAETGPHPCSAQQAGPVAARQEETRQAATKAMADSRAASKLAAHGVQDKDKTMRKNAVHALLTLAGAHLCPMNCDNVQWRGGFCLPTIPEYMRMQRAMGEQMWQQLGNKKHRHSEWGACWRHD